MITNKLQFLAQTVAPHPQEVDYWIDLTSDPYGTIIRTWNGKEWKQISELSYDDIKALQTRMTNAETKISSIEKQNHLSDISTSVTDSTIDITVTTQQIGSGVTSSSVKSIPAATESTAGALSASDKVKLDKVITDGSGNSSLFNDGTYKESYTKTQVDSIKTALEQTISTLDTDKYDKTETYSKAEVDNKITQAKADILDSAPEELNTLEELAAALGDDPNFATTVMNNIGTKVSQPSGDGLQYFANDNTYKTLTKVTVGLDNVDNTADIDKPISTATQAALDTKVDKVSGKQLSTNDYTTADKSKLDSIDLSQFLTKAEYNHLTAMLHNTTINNNKYYGVSFPIAGPADTFLTRTGNLEWHKTLPIQSLMKTCTITSDGVVKYLKADDRTKYEDDSERDYTLNTMVEIPEFWYKCSKDDTTVYLDLFPENPNIDDAEHVQKFYIAAYEGQTVDNVFKSINNSGGIPTVNKTIATMQSEARANNSSSTNWNIYTYKAHVILCVLYLVEYACTNSQADFNNTLTAEGYKQGGLGDGVTIKSTYASNGTTIVYSYVPCGITDSLGNSTGVIEYQANGYNNTGTAETFAVSVPSYRGIENPFGHVWKATCDSMVHHDTNNNTTALYLTTDREKFASSQLSDYQFQHYQLNKRNCYKNKLIYNSWFSILPPADDLGSAANNTYWCDYHYTVNSSMQNRWLCLGGRSGNGADSGLLYADCDDAWSTASSTVGSRLIYLL